MSFTSIYKYNYLFAKHLERREFFNLEKCSHYQQSRYSDEGTRQVLMYFN